MRAVGHSGQPPGSPIPLACRARRALGSDHGGCGGEAHAALHTCAPGCCVGSGRPPQHPCEALACCLPTLPLPLPLPLTPHPPQRISITNTVVALGAAPAIVTWADGVSMVSRVGLAASLVFFGIITTGEGG